VLGDLVGPAADGLLVREEARTRLADAARQEVPATAPPACGPVGDGIVVLRRVHRFAGAIAELAEAVRIGDAQAALDVLRGGHGDVRWIEVDVAEHDAREALSPVRDTAVAAGQAIVEAAREGDGAAALAALGTFRLLCAHRRGPYGVATWNTVVESWLTSELDRFAEDVWYVGKPLLVTRNDYGLKLFNGDTGVIVARTDGRKSAAFERRGRVVEISPTRLDAVETLHALTIHKSQGSQVDTRFSSPTPAPGSSRESCSIRQSLARGSR
jgi:exodeoxyribonuclease V alpha subunit